MNFREWLLENSGEQITIDLSKYTAAIDQEIERIIAGKHQRKADLAGLDVSGHHQFIQQNLPQAYPQRQQLLQHLQGGNDWDSHVAQYSKWALDQGHDQTQWEIFRRLRDLQDYAEKDEEFNEDEIRQWTQQLVQESQQNMEKIQAMIQQAIQGIAEWNGTSVIIEAEASSEGFNDVSLSPATYAGVIMGKRGDVYAHFTLFPTEDLQGVHEIGDILEGGWDEQEFFATPQVKEDYFNLINELRNPGSTSKGKVLTLYTARPEEDHEFYANTTYLPINVFLTNSPSHAEGLARDLHGGEGGRDIWMVRIDSRYLTQTLDGPVKYYMVTKDKAPVVSIKPY